MHFEDKLAAAATPAATTGSPVPVRQLEEDLHIGFEKLARAYGTQQVERMAADAMVSFVDQDRPLIFHKDVAVRVDEDVVVQKAEAALYVQHPAIARPDDWPAFPREWRVSRQLLGRVPGADGLHVAGWQAADGGLVLRLASSAGAAQDLLERHPDLRDAAVPDSRGWDVVQRRLTVHNLDLAVPLPAAAKVVHAESGPSEKELEELRAAKAAGAGAGTEWVRRCRRVYGERLRVEQVHRAKAGGVSLTVALYDAARPLPLRELPNLYMAYNEDLQAWTIDRPRDVPEQAFECVACRVVVDEAQAPPSIRLDLRLHCDPGLLEGGARDDHDADMEEEAHDGGGSEGGADDDAGGSAAAARRLDIELLYKRVAPQGVTHIVLGFDAAHPRDACLLQLEPELAAWRLQGQESPNRIAKTDLAAVRHAHLAAHAPLEGGGMLPLAHAKRNVKVSQVYFKLAPVPAAETEEARAARQAALGGYAPAPTEADLSTAEAELGLVRQQERSAKGEDVSRVRAVLRFQHQHIWRWDTYDLGELLRDRPELAPVLGMRRLVDLAGVARGEQPDTHDALRVAVADVLSPTFFGAATKQRLVDAGWGSCWAPFDRFAMALTGQRIHQEVSSSPKRRRSGAQQSRGGGRMRTQEESSAVGGGEAGPSQVMGLEAIVM